MWRRTTARLPEAIEQVMDEIAARVGLWAAIVRPALAVERERHSTLLDAFLAAHAKLAPDASREAAFKAFAHHCDHPVLVVRSDYDSRSDGRLDSYALRAKTVIMNDAAERTGFRIWKKYRIRPESVIGAARSSAVTLQEENDLGRWKSETASPLAARRVLVTAHGRWATIEATG